MYRGTAWLAKPMPPPRIRRPTKSMATFTPIVCRRAPTAKHAPPHTCRSAQGLACCAAVGRPAARQFAGGSVSSLGLGAAHHDAAAAQALEAAAALGEDQHQEAGECAWEDRQTIWTHQHACDAPQQDPHGSVSVLQTDGLIEG